MKDIYVDDSDKPNSLRRPSVLALTPDEVLAEAGIEEKESDKKEEESVAEAPGKITFINAWCLPNVFLYASAFFFSKFAVYAIMYNLPEFLRDVYGFDSNQQANISTMNDSGAIIGSFAMGIISDFTWGKRSPSAMFAVIASAAIFYTMTFTYKSIDYTSFMIYFLFFGIFLQGVNNTISSVCSADIGRSSGRAKNVTSTVTGIIDGTGSIGSSIAMYTIGAAKNAHGWKWGFLMPVSICCTICMIPIAIVLNKECK